MTHPVKGIDHCFVLVDDLDDAARRYEAMGFTLSPRGVHSESKGSANYTIMFPNDYFELLGLTRPTEMNATRRAALESQGEGLHAVACRIDNAEAAAEALGGLGIGTHGLGSFERPVPLPGGDTGIAAFSTVAYAPEEVPLGIVFMCQHKTRDTVWIDELLHHANTACGLDAIVALSADPEADAAGFARLWAAGNVTQVPLGVTVETGPNSAPLVLMRAEDMAARYPGANLGKLARGAFAGMRIKVADMAAARACLDKSGIPAIETPEGVAVPPEAGCGAFVEFVPA
ncbi:MAG: VOC family protein [Paracoccaceae bacterium]